MDTIRRYFKIALATASAIIIAPIVAFFGLIMLGLTFGLSLFAVAKFVKTAQDIQAEREKEENAAST